VAHEPPQQPQHLARVAEELVQDQPPQLLGADAMDLLPGKDGGIDRRALEVFVPVARVVHEAPPHELLPERRAAVDAEPVEGEGVQPQPRGEAERLPHVLLGLVRVAHHEEAVDDLDARLLRVGHGSLDLLERLLLLEPVEDLLAAALDPEHDGPAAGLRHHGEKLHADGVHPALASPLDGDLLLDEPLADGLDAPRLEQEVIVHEVDGSVALRLQPLELRHHVLRAARAPLALVEDRDVAEDAGPGAAARGLHGREALQREDGGHVEGHRLDEVQAEALAVRERPLVEVAGQGPVVVVAEPAFRVAPGDAQDAGGIVERREQVEDELLAIPAAHEVHLGTLELDQLRVQAGEDAAKGDPDPRVRRADLARQDLRVRVAGGGEEAQPDQVRLEARDLAQDDVVGRPRVGLIEHQALVPGPLQHRRQGHDADGREAHDLDAPVPPPPLGWDGVELRIADVDEDDLHAAVCNG
jgi:hypothetical protein